MEYIVVASKDLKDCYVEDWADLFKKPRQEMMSLIGKKQQQKKISTARATWERVLQEVSLLLEMCEKRVDGD